MCRFNALDQENVFSQTVGLIASSFAYVFMCILKFFWENDFVRVVSSINTQTSFQIFCL